MSMHTIIWECSTPLPDGWNGVELVTSYFEDMFADDHKVTEDGTLMISTVLSVNQVPKENRPYPNDTGVKGMFGSLNVETELRQSDLTGYIDMCGYDDDFEYHDYMAKFKDGKLVKIIMREEYLRLIADV